MKKHQISPQLLQKRILAWYDKFGRKTLPWQQDKTPYRVWLSEIMLQQTQVATVIPYYERFLARFKKIEELAAASLDEVLHLWTGLGYYSRARNLHKTANIIAENRRFPDNLQELQELPGIGRSTAGAILSIAFQQPTAILDGNVKRVLARLHAIKTWPGEKKTHDALWELAESYTPKKRVADYTQAMMDIGATLCVRGTPLCHACPIQDMCRAHTLGVAKQLPAKKPSKPLPTRQVTLLILQNTAQAVLLEKRPAEGIWGGLWSLPEIAKHVVSEKEVAKHCLKHFQIPAEAIYLGKPFKHTFSHYHLQILPAYVQLKTRKAKIIAGKEQIWYNLAQPDTVGLPAPIKKLLLGIAL